ncbi:hypothetical protein M8818_003617 [Zalaria obscura]|uniref:Uncharacterized protein n=1 Tax=Zalaria obscura TaxID=2024903 RepID=A0ACC3SET2_9PEZI
MQVGGCELVAWRISSGIAGDVTASHWSLPSANGFGGVELVSHAATPLSRDVAPTHSKGAEKVSSYRHKHAMLLMSVAFYESLRRAGTRVHALRKESADVQHAVRGSTTRAHMSAERTAISLDVGALEK